MGAVGPPGNKIHKCPDRDFCMLNVQGTDFLRYCGVGPAGSAGVAGPQGVEAKYFQKSSIRGIEVVKIPWH